MTPAVDEEPVYFYSKALNRTFYFLSNFQPSPFVLDGKQYATVEHYFQSCKYTDPERQELVRNAPTPKEAKRLGRKWPHRPDWFDISESVMLKALRAKFDQNPDLRERLMATGNRPLHEDSPRDMYWGCRGKDRLGVLLGQVRDEIRKKTGET